MLFFVIFGFVDYQCDMFGLFEDIVWIDVFVFFLFEYLSVCVVEWLLMCYEYCQ